MKKLILTVALLALAGGAYAGPVADQLGSQAGVTASNTDVQTPSVPVDTKGISGSACNDYPMTPGCPKYCHTVGWGSPVCPPPLYCGTNPNGYGCPKSVDAKSIEEKDGSFDATLAKANCTANPNAPGCPLYCKDHHSYPGCPMYCQLNPLAPACGHVPEYCSTNPNGYNCPKSAGTKAAGQDGFDEDVAKANCSANPLAPGCPLYCKDHHSYPGCPMFCQLNPLSPACGHVPAYCGTNPAGFGCQKMMEEATDENGEMKKANGFVPPHPQFCGHHHGLCK